MAAHPYQGSELSAQFSRRTVYSPLAEPVTMEAKSQRPKDRKSAISLLNAAIEAVNLAKEIASVTPAKAAFGIVSVLLTMVKVRSLPFRNDLPQAHSYPGQYGQRAGIRRTWVTVRRHLYSA